ncbi:MAG: hypothetical protein H6719_00645 [Sandaracinaceae bacterium]|nr:hypothetical protein [Sandaracinaceae bacterium]
MSALRVPLLSVLLVTHGCADTHQLLLDRGTSEAPWTDCTGPGSGVEDGAHRDACAIAEGSLCTVVGETDTQRVLAMCLDGSLIRSTARVAARTIPAGRCEEPNVRLSAHTEWYVQTGGPGCLSLATCDGGPGFGGVYELCPAPMVSGPRPGAESISPWTDCEEILEGGTDGDPCAGSEICAGVRHLEGSYTSNPLLAWCDAGILRMYAPPLSPTF